MVERLVMEDASVFSRELNDNIETDSVVPEEPKNGNQGDQGEKAGPTNATHYNPSDPDARLTTKPGKPTRLYYRSQMSVDTASHFITYIQAFKGNEEDKVTLPVMLSQIVQNMAGHAIRVEEVLADAGYSSGKAIRALIAHDIQGYIPNPGKYKSSRENEGFKYDAENDRYTCVNGVHLPFRRIEAAYNQPDILKKIYESNISDCKNCPFKQRCANAKGFKKLTDTADKPLYEYM